MANFFPEGAYFEKNAYLSFMTSGAGLDIAGIRGLCSIVFDTEFLWAPGPEFQT